MEWQHLWIPPNSSKIASTSWGGVKEDSGSIINESYTTNKMEPVDNYDFDNLATIEGILDFSEKNPFGEISV